MRGLRGSLARIGVLAAILPVAGCALLPPTPQTDALLGDGMVQPRHWENSHLPLVLQDPDFCGPAALAMSLGAIGIAATQEDLGTKVFLPGRSGTLQTEMLAGPRQFGVVSFELPRNLSDLLQEANHGHTPIVLLNLGLSWAPRWHYALVMGYDLDHREITLRSGTDAREVIPLKTFEYTWARSNYWAMTITRPGDVPQSVQPEQAEQAALGFERINTPQQAARVWASLAQRWPDRLLAYLGWGNALTALGHHDEAERIFKQGTEHVDSAVLWNNLAQARLTQHNLSGAREAAQTGLALAQAREPRWTAALQDTLNTIEQASRPCTTPGSGC